MSFAFETPRRGTAALFTLQLSRQLPTLTTGRLILRAPRVTDFDTFAEIACSPRGMPLGGPMSPEDAWTEFAHMTSEWPVQGHGLWTIGHAGSVAGFVRLSRAPDGAEPELSVLLTEIAEGQALAFEAASAARCHAFETLGWTSLVSYIAPENTRAIALAQRLGGYRDGSRDGAHIWRYPRTGGAA